MASARVREQLNLHAAVLLAAVRRAVVCNGVVLADADQVEPVRGNVVLRGQILHHRIGAALAQVIVVLRRSGRVGSTRHFENVALGRAQLPSKAVELIFVVLGQHGLVEAEVHGRVRHRLVVVETLHNAVERIGAVHRIVRRSLCIACCLGRSLRVLGGVVGCGLGLLDAGLRTIVGVANRAAVRRRLIFQLSGVIHNRSGLGLHPILGRATRCTHHRQRSGCHPKAKSVVHIVHPPAALCQVLGPTKAEICSVRLLISIRRTKLESAAHLIATIRNQISYAQK